MLWPFERKREKNCQQLFYTIIYHSRRPCQVSISFTVLFNATKKTHQSVDRAFPRIVNKDKVNLQRCQPKEKKTQKTNKINEKPVKNHDWWTEIQQCFFSLRFPLKFTFILNRGSFFSVVLDTWVVPCSFCLLLYGIIVYLGQPALF